MRHLAMLLCMFAFVADVSCAQSFNYASFSGIEPISSNGTATLVGNVYRLNPPVNWNAGSIFHQTQMQVANGFDTTFTFRINTDAADGMAFVIHNDMRGDTLLGDNGSALGYAPQVGAPPGTGTLNGLVVEIDTWAGPSDTSANEISVHTNGTAEMSYDESQSLGQFTPSTDMSDGLAHTIRVLYAPGTLDIFFDGATTPQLSIPYDFATGGTHIIPNTPVGGLTLAGGAAWIGFTGATGGAAETHDIESWSFSSVTITDDVAVTHIEAPMNNSVDCSTLSATESVTINLRNAGLNPIAAGTVLTTSFQIDSNPPTVEFLSLATALDPGDTLLYTFNGTADLSAPGNYTISSNVVYGLDLNTGNDSVTSQVGSGGQLRISAFPYLQDFTVTGANGSTDLPLGFINEATDTTGTNSDWITRSNPTPTSGAGPAADHTTGTSGLGGYVHLEDDSNHGTINMRSPCFDLAGLVNPSLRFYLHSHDLLGPAQSNLLSVDIIAYPGAAITMDVHGPLGQTGPDWELQAVDLTAFAGSLVQVIFRGQTSNSAGDTHDIAIDDLSLGDLLPTPGQAPQPGLAVLHMNDAVNPNLDPLAFGFGGPYFSSVSAGDTLIFRMEGEQFQPIILFAGPLNPAVASFSGIGTIDVGGTVDPMSGLPSGLTVVADGNVFGGFNSFFITSATGVTQVGFTVPNLPLGVIGTFQSAFTTTSGPGIALSNAIQLTIQ